MSAVPLDRSWSVPVAATVSQTEVTTINQEYCIPQVGLQAHNSPKEVCVQRTILVASGSVAADHTSGRADYLD
jgi:hypothetical protein